MTVRSGEVRLVIAGGSEHTRAALKRLVEAEPSWRVVGWAPDPLSGFRVARERGADVLLLDSTPGEPSFPPPLLRSLAAQQEPFAVLSLVDHPGGSAQAAGPSVTKGIPGKRLRQVIAEVVARRSIATGSEPGSEDGGVGS